ncbi:MAG: serine--tRNA ligase [archaeon]
MIDIKLIRETPGIVKQSQKKRGLDEKEIDRLVDLDSDWRKTKQETDSLRQERNRITIEINEAKKQGKSIENLIHKAKQIPQELAKKDEILNRLEAERNEILENIPNIVDKSVPLGTEEKNKVIGKVGTPKKIPNAKGHEELLNALDQIDIERAGKVAGARFYYLKKELVKLNYAIINFALDTLMKKGFTLMQPPYMLRREALKGAITLSAFEEMIYKIQDEDLYLIGTAEHALNAYYMNEVLPADKLPIRFAGISPCFRKEAGSHGKDTKGIFRIHQFEKVEQFVFCKPEQAQKEFDLILENTKEIFRKLEIPFRIVLLASQDMGRSAAKTVDIEGWFPSQKVYRELGSCSNCTDYQARRSSIKYNDKGERKFVYTLNNTAIATERAIVAIVENQQQKDGSIKIPKALWQYTGFKEIKADKPVSKAKIKNSGKKATASRKSGKRNKR